MAASSGSLTAGRVQRVTSHLYDCVCRELCGAGPTYQSPSLPHQAPRGRAGHRGNEKLMRRNEADVTGSLGGTDGAQILVLTHTWLSK